MRRWTLYTDASLTSFAAAYSVAELRYQCELSDVKHLYSTHKKDPPASRNMAPVIGRILWARQLLRGVREPMQAFQQRCPQYLQVGAPPPPLTHTQPIVTALLASKAASHLQLSPLGMPNVQTGPGRAVVKAHNSAARALMEYEVAWHRAWCDAVKRSRVGANAPVLARHPNNGRLCVNLDPATWQLVREAQCMERLGLEIPAAAAELCERATGMRHIQAALLHALRRYGTAQWGNRIR